MENVETLIYLLLGLPLLAAANTLLLARFKNLRDGQAILLGLVTSACAYALYTSPTAALETVTLVQLAPQLTLTFTPEPLGMLFALVAGALWPLGIEAPHLPVGMGRKNAWLPVCSSTPSLIFPSLTE